MVKDIFAFAMKNSGKEVSTDVCEHFHHTRQELYDIVKVMTEGQTPHSRGWLTDPIPSRPLVICWVVKPAVYENHVLYQPGSMHERKR